ncbi:MAG: ABC transporter permease subunit [Alteraurantiacibacter sp.]
MVQVSGTKVIPAPAATARQVVLGVSQGWLVSDVLASLQRVGLGVATGAVVAFAIACPLMFWRAGMPLVDGAISLLRPVPAIAWVPTALILFGIGDGAAIAVVALASFFPMVLGLMSGIAQTGREHLIAATVFGRTKLSTVIHVVLPSALIPAAHALRVAAAIGWFSVVAAEMLGASEGLGYGVQVSGLNLDLEKLFAYIAAIGLTGALLDRVIAWSAEALIPWAPKGAI